MVERSTDRFNGVVASLAIKAPCVAVAIANITLSGTQTVNGVAVVSGDRVLVIAQTDATENGIYDVDSSAWSRSADWDGNRDVTSGTFVTVATANVGRNPYYQVTTANPITIGTTAINFTLADGPNVSYALTAAEITEGLTDDDIDDSYEPGNVVRYGVLGDGGDDFAAMQIAADVVSVNGGKYVVPRFSGTIMTSSIIEFTGSNIEVEVNNDITCTGTAAANAGVFRFLGATGAYLENLKMTGIGMPVLDGNGDNVTGFIYAPGFLPHQCIGFHWCQKIEVSGFDLRNGLIDCLLLNFCQDGDVHHCIGRDAVHDNNFSALFNKHPGDITTDTDPSLWARHKFYSNYSTGANDFGYTALRAHDVTFTECDSYLDEIGLGSEELVGAKFANGQVIYDNCFVNKAINRGVSVSRNNTTLKNVTVDGVTVTITDADGTQVLEGNGISATAVSNLKVLGGAYLNCSNKGISNFSADGSGTHDGSNNASTLSDSGAFTADRLIGATVYNTTDGSFGVVTDNTDSLVTATLAGGTDNDWDNGDAYVIIYENSSVELRDVEINGAGYDAVYSANADKLVLTNAQIIGSGRKDVHAANTLKAASKVNIRDGDFSGEINLAKVNRGIVKGPTVIDARLVAADCGRLWLSADIIFSDGFAGFNSGIVVLTTDFCSTKGCTADGNVTPIDNQATIRLGDNDGGIVYNRGSESGDSVNNYSVKGFESANSTSGIVGDFPKNSMIWSNVGDTGTTMGWRVKQAGTKNRTLDAAVAVSGTTANGEAFFTADNIQNLVRGNYIGIAGESKIYKIMRTDASINKIWMDQTLTGDRDTSAVTYSTPVIVAMPNYV